MTEDSIGAAAVAVLACADARKKADRSREMAEAWRAGRLAPVCDRVPPDRPARPARPRLLDPGDMPRRGGAGSRANRIALLHALAHIELNAIDLAWDIIARFGAGKPRAFLDDWVDVADDEARHFVLLSERLAALGAAYGDLPAHDGLWQAAVKTRQDFGARLAIVPLVLEARGLDVTPAMIERLRRTGDPDSAAVLETILDDEIGHVARGWRWFDWACREQGRDPVAHFHALVRAYHGAGLKPPFNETARRQAGLAPACYRPLAQGPC